VQADHITSHRSSESTAMCDVHVSDTPEDPTQLCGD
jgi:hypothetical protein